MMSKIRTTTTQMFEYFYTFALRDLYSLYFDGSYRIFCSVWKSMFDTNVVTLPSTIVTEQWVFHPNSDASQNIQVKAMNVCRAY